MSDINIDAVKAKLKKLLALAGSDNAHEASLAMERAQTLMEKYNLRTIDVAADGSGAYVGTQEVEGTGEIATTWESQLGWAIAQAFDGEAVRSKLRHGGWKFTFIAGKTDLEIIVDLFARLRETVPRMSRTYLAGLPSWEKSHGARTLGNNYRLGVVSTINQRLRALRKPAAASTPSNCRDLVVVKNKAVAQRTASLFPRLKQAKPSKARYAAHAYAAGQADGNRVNLGRSISGQGTAPAALGW